MKKLLSLLGVFAVLVGTVYWATVIADNKPQPYLTLTAAEVQEKVDRGEDFSVYVYRDTCQYCREFAPILNGYLQENDKKIYRVSTEKKSEENDVRRILGDKFQGTPALYSFKEKEINDYFVGVQTKEKLDAYAKKNEAIFYANEQ